MGEHLLATTEHTRPVSTVAISWNVATREILELWLKPETGIFLPSRQAISPRRDTVSVL